MFVTRNFFFLVLHKTKANMLPSTAAIMRQSAVPTTAGTTVPMMVDVPGTLLEGVAITLVVIETVLIVDVVKCVWVSKKYVPISGTR